jgi:hypothetical protein
MPTAAATATTQLRRLGADEVAAYRRDGFLFPRGELLPPEDFADLQRTFERLLGDWTGRFGQRPEMMDKPHWIYPELTRFTAHPRVLDLVEDLIGPDIVFFTSHFFCKPPGDGMRVPWHEDSAYWAGLMEPMEDVLTIWLALDPSTAENGCVRFVPGSHLTPDGAYGNVADPKGNVFQRELVPEAAAEAERTAVDSVLSPGRCSIHHAKTIHGSRPNRSAMRRCGLTLRYFSSACRWTYQERDPDFPIYLVRGRDHAGNPYAPLGEVNAVARDRLLAEASKPARS